MKRVRFQGRERFLPEELALRVERGKLWVVPDKLDAKAVELKFSNADIRLVEKPVARPRLSPI
jgi:hypothetical protein